MRTQGKPDRRTGWALLSAAAAVWLTLASPDPVRELPSTTRRFFCYFSELNQTGRHLNLWDRLAISLVLAGHESVPARDSGRRPES
ncbi:MAG: hypothetical protein NZR01_06295 [Bryobacteraceae bacterium]|nr:hypothetical protein [Bryobacteraceae bacterium]